MRTTLSGAALCAVLASAACDHTPPPTAPALDAETTRQLFEHMEELVAALRTRAATPIPRDIVGAAVPAVATPERTPADASTTALHERLEALEREVAQLLGAATRHVAMAPPRATLPPPRNPASVELAVDQVGNDASRPEVRRSFFLLSRQQVLDQLGAPDSFDVVRDGCVNWKYQVGTKVLRLTFYDGVVMDVNGWTQ